MLLFFLQTHDVKMSAQIEAGHELTEPESLEFILTANAAKELLAPYFPPVIESLKGFLTTSTEQMRSLQTQSLGTSTELEPFWTELETPLH